MDASQIALGGVFAGVTIWLLSWMSKHTLDRMVLPRFLDWWARRSKQRALRKGRLVVGKYNGAYIATIDAKFMILRTESQSQDRIIALGSMAMIFAISLPDEAPSALHLAESLLRIFSILWFMFIMIFQANQLKMLRTIAIKPDDAKAVARERASALFIVAGLDAKEIDAELGILKEK